MTSSSYDVFQQTVWNYYHEHGRDLPWRHSEPDGSFDPYKIMISEIMLQQTQAARVVPKYHEFISLFPTVQELAQAPLADVLKAWSGLGYNRRAKFLWQATQQIKDVFPGSLEELVALPGIGVNTAGAILAYGFNKPVVFIETNIRTVYIHHFFADHVEVHDKEIMPLVEATLDQESPREWYWALMDYGTFIKSTIGNASRSSRHYAKQSTFAGSKRQIRGQVIRLLTSGPQSVDSLRQNIPDERLGKVLDTLIKEQLIQLDGRLYRL
jgi:A/G-specific adenine glycosylase